MNQTLSNDFEPSSQVVWARAQAFPEAPEGYGWIDQKNRFHPCPSLEELAQIIREDQRGQIDLVWTPHFPFCQIPEELPDLIEPIKEVRTTWAKLDLENTQSRLRNFGILLFLLLGYLSLQIERQIRIIEKSNGTLLNLEEKTHFILQALMNSTVAGIALLLFLLCIFIPWYQARKKMGEINRTGENPAMLIPLLRFETWLHRQKAPVTWILITLLSLVFLAQIKKDGSFLFFHESIKQLGLDKTSYRAGEYGRLFTAPLLHGGFIHFAMNALSLLYLGKRLEVFARWPHLTTVFLLSALLGGEFSARMTEQLSVGASGGLIGCLGFLLIFETLHSKLVPKSAMRRLFAGLLTTVLIGLIGHRFIDNAAHIGGLIAGMLYATIVFPKSLSVIRPKTTRIDLFVGSISLATIALSCLLILYRYAA